MNQLAFDLSPRPTAYQAHSRTSKVAAFNAQPKAGTKRAILLDFIQRQRHLGATDEEMQASLPMNPNTQRPRRVELVQGHWVMDSGRTRKTLGGDEAVVWVSAEFK